LIQLISVVSGDARFVGGVCLIVALAIGHCVECCGKIVVFWLFGHVWTAPFIRLIGDREPIGR
jgi:hypothetical protein